MDFIMLDVTDVVGAKDLKFKKDEVVCFGYGTDRVFFLGRIGLNELKQSLAGNAHTVSGNACRVFTVQMRDLSVKKLRTSSDAVATTFQVISTIGALVLRLVRDASLGKPEISLCSFLKVSV